MEPTTQLRSPAANCELRESLRLSLLNVHANVRVAVLLESEVKAEASWLWLHGQVLNSGPEYTSMSSLPGQTNHQERRVVFAERQRRRQGSPGQFGPHHALDGLLFAVRSREEPSADGEIRVMRAESPSQSCFAISSSLAGSSVALRNLSLIALYLLTACRAVCHHQSLPAFRF